MKLREVMIKPVFVSSEESLDRAAKLIARTNSNGLLVGSATALEGIVTKEDLIKHFGHSERVSEIMTKKIISVESSESTETVIQILKKNRINLIPVTEKKKIIGVVSGKDLLEGKEEKEFLFD